MRDGSPARPGSSPDRADSSGREPQAVRVGGGELAEPRSRREVADEAHARTVRSMEGPPPDGRGTVAQTPADRQDRDARAARHVAAGQPDTAGRSGGATRQEHADGHDRGDHRFCVVQADRTIGDTTPAGIGLKPSGEQLRDMESDKLSRRARFRKEFYREADGIQDVSENTANDVTALLGRHPPTGHPETS